jgi:hypothetical protein
VTREVGRNLASRGGDERDDVRLDGDLGDGNGLAREHRLVDDGVSGEEKKVGGEGGEVVLGKVDEVTRNEIDRVAHDPYRS